MIPLTQHSQNSKITKMVDRLVVAGVKDGKKEEGGCDYKVVA